MIGYVKINACHILYKGVEYSRMCYKIWRNNNGENYRISNNGR